MNGTLIVKLLSVLRNYQPTCWKGLFNRDKSMRQLSDRFSVLVSLIGSDSSSELLRLNFVDGRDRGVYARRLIART